MVTETPADDEFVPMEFACAGYTFLKGKMYVRLHRLNKDRSLKAGKTDVYEIDKYLRGLTVGAIYVAPATDKKIRHSHIKFVKWGGDVASVAPNIDGWQVVAKAAQTEKTLHDQEKKSAEYADAMRSLNPLRRLYNATNADGKLAIEVRLLAYLRRRALGG